jgi:glucose-1-phosphate adenylyltransferase
LQVDTTVLGCTPEEAAERPYIASMGIYVFKRAVLCNLLGQNPDQLDFGGDVIPFAKETGVTLPMTSMALLLA